MVATKKVFFICVLSWAWTQTGFAKVYKLSSQHESEAVQMRDPIMPGDAAEDARIDFSEKSEAIEKKPNMKKVSKKASRASRGKNRQISRKLPKHTKTQQNAEEIPGKLKFSAYAIGGRLEQPRVEFTLEPLPLPTNEEPVQIDYKEKLREMSTQKELGL